MRNIAKLTQLKQKIDQNAVYVDQEVHGFQFQGHDIVMPHYELLEATASHDNLDLHLFPTTANFCRLLNGV